MDFMKPHSLLMASQKQKSLQVFKKKTSAQKKSRTKFEFPSVLQKIIVSKIFAGKKKHIQVMPSLRRLVHRIPQWSSIFAARRANAAAFCVANVLVGLDLEWKDSVKMDP